MVHDNLSGYMEGSRVVLQMANFLQGWSAHGNLAQIVCGSVSPFAKGQLEKGRS